MQDHEKIALQAAAPLRAGRSGLSMATLMVAAVLVLLAVLACSSLLAMVGDINAAHAKRLERSWEKQPTALTLQRWQAADAYLHNALTFSPAHPDYLQALGRLSTWYLLVAEAVEPAQLPPTAGHDYGARGLEYFRAAVAQRPYWAYGWSELAFLKARLGQVDDEFALAMRAAVQQGPFERQVLSNVLNAGLGSWEQLTLAQQMEVHAVFRRMITLHWTVRSAMELVEFYGMKAGFCFGISDAPDISESIKRRCAR